MCTLFSLLNPIKFTLSSLPFQSLKLDYLEFISAYQKQDILKNDTSFSDIEMNINSKAAFLHTNEKV